MYGLLTGIYLLWVLLSTAVILHLFGFVGIMRSFLLTISTPAIILSYQMDKESPSLAVFNYASQIMLSLVTTAAIVLINTALGGGRATDLLIRIIVYPIIIYLEWHFIRTPFRKLTSVVQKGWGILSLIPISFNLLLVLLGTVPVHYIERPTQLLYIGGCVVVIIIVYFSLFQSLIWQYRMQLLTRDRDLLQVQIASFAKQSEAVSSAEDKLRILRHDTRHFASVIHACLLEGDMKKAAEALSMFESGLSSAAPASYCSDYLINSILSAYFEKARQHNIQTYAAFIPPLPSSINTSALAVTLANALENALDACLLEQPPCRIMLKGRSYNRQYFLELSNTCRTSVKFGQDGLPMSAKGQGHGFGTRSISAFAKENHAFLPAGKSVF